MLGLLLGSGGSCGSGLGLLLGGIGENGLDAGNLIVHSQVIKDDRQLVLGQNLHVVLGSSCVLGQNFRDGLGG